jgi:uncharacterized membrane protein YdjX (TVP38/TMEM64 family)
VLAAAVAVIIWREPLAALFADRERVANAVRGAGAWGPLLLIGLTVAQVIAAPIPGQAVNFVAGYLYGFWLGGLLSWLGLVLGSILAMTLARVGGRPLVARLLPPRALARLDDFARDRGLAFFFVLFVLPFLPDDLACFAAGLTSLPLPALFVVAVAGRIPGVMLSTWLGAHAEQLTWPAWVAAGVVLLLILLAAWRSGPRLQKLLLRRSDNS